MSFLAPFYLLATLAIGLPIAFHLIRRSPQGRQIFSSVMFLQPDPPRMTKRSRLEDWLLLLLRAAAICLLALAFARPFLTAQESAEVTTEPGDKIVVLVDTSASLRRGDCWEQTRTAIRELETELKPQDLVSVLVFDESTRELIGFENWNSLPVEARRSAIHEAIENENPTWLGTRTGAALIQAAELLEEEESGRSKKVVLISDLQSGGGWDALNGYVWPEDVELRLVSVRPAEASNAALHLADGSAPSPDLVRVRVTNTADSTGDAFHVGARDRFGGSDGIDPEATVVSLSVQPGQSRIVNVPRGKGVDGGLAMVLTGDQTDFDNTIYTVRESIQQLKIVYLGADQEEAGSNGLRFFLDAVFPKTSWREVSIVDWRTEDSPPLVPRGDADSLNGKDSLVSWLIVGGTPTAPKTAWIRNWVQQGGAALFVARNSQQALSLYDLLGLPPQEVEDVAPPSEFTLLQNVDLSYPPLKQFDDPRFSDFTKIRFWKYRKYASLPVSDARVLATFENQVPALGEIKLGEGRILLLTSGWNRSDSDLAVSSKFVPLMNAILENVSPPRKHRFQYRVGQELPLGDLQLSNETIVMLHGGKERSLRVNEPFRIESPGIYRFGASKEQAQGEEATLVAANLDPQESRTDPLPRDLLAAYGLKFEAPVATAKAELDPSQKRQLMNAELEAKQNWWRWILVATILVVIAESLIALMKANARTMAPVEA